MGRPAKICVAIRPLKSATRMLRLLPGEMFFISVLLIFVVIVCLDAAVWSTIVLQTAALTP
jgi:hypothetical protein